MVGNIIKKMQARENMETDKLIYAGALVVSDIVGMIKPKTKKKKPWWKQRLEGQVKQMQKDLGFITKLIEKEIMKKNEERLRQWY